MIGKPIAPFFFEEERTLCLFLSEKLNIVIMDKNGIISKNLEKGNKMKEKIKIPIKDVIIKEENIKKLANILLEQEDVEYIKFNISFRNEQEIESDNISVFDNEKVKGYEIKSIRMHYAGKEYKKEINIWINNYELYEGYCYIEIAYENQKNLDWLAVKEKQFNEAIQCCEKRNKSILILKNDNVLFCVLLVISALLAWIVGKTIVGIFNINQEALIQISACIFMLLLICSLYFKNLLSNAFPKVEIDIKETCNSAKKARKKLYTIFGVCIIPFISDIIFSVIKKNLGIG